MCNQFLKYKFVYFVIVIILMGTEANVTDEDYALMPLVFHMDNYDHCQLLGKEALFCSITIDLSPASRRNSSKVWNIIQEVSKNDKNYNHAVLRHGICIKESCPEIVPDALYSTTRNLSILMKEISKCYTNKYSDKGLKSVVRTIHCQNEAEPVQLDNFETFSIVAGVVYICVVLFATFYERLSRYRTEMEYIGRTNSPGFGQFISCFSIIINWKRLTATSHVHSLQSIQGVRCISVVSIICHHYFLLRFSIGVSNTLYTETIFHQKIYLFLTNLFTCQPFFLFSSWIVTINFLKAFQKQDVQFIHIIKLFIYRYLRLIPCVVALVLGGIILKILLPIGPYYTFFERHVQHCKDNWWTNILLINNYYNIRNQCCPQTWYLAADTHLYLLVLIILYAITKFRKFVKFILGLAIVVAVLVPMVINYVNDYDVTIRANPEKLYHILVNDDFLNYSYMPSHTNMGAAVLGIIFGYVFYNIDGLKVLSTRMQVAIWYMVIIGPIIVLTILQGAFFDEPYIGHRFLNALYVGLSRNIYTFCIGLLVLGISQGHGWFLRDLLNWSPFQTLGKLYFGAYLLHPLLQAVQIGSLRVPIYMDFIFSSSKAVSGILPIFIFATIMCLFVEMPFGALLKLYVPQAEDKEGLNAKGGKQK